MYAPNMPADRMTGDVDLDTVLESPEACGDDDCWERRSHALQLRLDGQGHAAHNCSQLSQIVSANWYLGAADIFAFKAAATDGSSSDGLNGSDGSGSSDRLALSIVKGCAGCAFTKADGTLADGKISLVASGKGKDYSHTGTVSADKDGSCRVHWGDNWRDFCQGKPCGGPEPGPPPPTVAACETMLTKGGFWQPYVAAPGWPLQ
jgi:hypothetical protein